MVRDTSEESEASVDEFATRYGALAGRWDKFHQDYDQWRGTEGGCDRSEVAKALGQFALTFGGLADRVRALPRATFLRPMGELFAEAAEREEEAIRHLRNTWRPFDTEVYQTLDRERSGVKRLRRQVEAGVQDLLGRYDIPTKEVSGGR